MIGELYAWWAEQMGAWVPARLRRRDAAHADALLVLPGPPPAGVSLILRRRGRERDLGRFDLQAPGASAAVRAVLPARASPPSVLLQAPAAALLEREVVLPLAAERDPGRVLSYEFDRLTPFTSAEVFWSYAVVKRDRARGRLQLRLSLIARAALADWLGALEHVGITPTAIEVATGDGARRIELNRVARERGRLARLASPALAGLCAMLAAAAVVLPFVRQSQASARIEARIAEVQPSVDLAEALRRRIAANAAALDVVAAERVRRGDPLLVLAELTDLLPDDTSLTDLTLNEGKLTFNGQSEAAARLIGALSADTIIHNPGFAAPVTRVDNGRADIFSIRAEVGQ